MSLIPQETLGDSLGWNHRCSDLVLSSPILVLQKPFFPLFETLYFVVDETEHVFLNVVAKFRFGAPEEHSLESEVTVEKPEWSPLVEVKSIKLSEHPGILVLEAKCLQIGAKERQYCHSSVQHKRIIGMPEHPTGSLSQSFVLLCFKTQPF